MLSYLMSSASRRRLFLRRAAAAAAAALEESAGMGVEEEARYSAAWEAGREGFTRLRRIIRFAEDWVDHSGRDGKEWIR